MKTLIHERTEQQIKAFIADPSHAIGISGEEGAGKNHLAKLIAAELLDVASIEAHPYVKVLDATAKAGIEDVRNLQEFLKLTVPGSNTIRRIAIIDHLDNLGHEAQNALLKTLEEPPVETVIIVTFSRRQRVLTTIHSRLQNISVLPVTQALATEYFSRHDAAAVTKSYYMSGGLSGLLTALLTDDTEHPLVSAIEVARELIQATRYQRLARIDTLLKDKKTDPLRVLDGMYRLLQAGYKQAVATKTNAQLQPMAMRLKLVEQAISDLTENIQTKLVLSRLFLEL